MGDTLRYTRPFEVETLTECEWLVPNGLGGYASATLCGMNTRRYHGLLVAALKPPSQRTLLVAKLEEVLEVAGQSYALAPINTRAPAIRKAISTSTSSRSPRMG